MSTLQTKMPSGKPIHERPGIESLLPHNLFRHLALEQK